MGSLFLSAKGPIETIEKPLLDGNVPSYHG